jgi:hypothetical protein
MMLVIAHEMYDIALGCFHAVDPFSHIMTEFAGATSGGALLLAAVSAIRNPIVGRGNPWPMRGK